MATFSDMATLLLTFFVLLLSFANMDVENFKVALGSVKEAFGVQMEQKGDFEAMSTSPVELSQQQSSAQLVTPKQDDVVAQAEKIRRYVRIKGLAKHIAVLATPRGVVLRIKNMVLFDTGSDILRPESVEILKLITDLFSRFEGTLSIEGHTDDKPISTGRFPSNWELSTARSTAVLRALVDTHKLDVTRMRVAGYAAVQPLGDNDTELGRGKNRRVEFVFERLVTVDVTGNKNKSKGSGFNLPF
jgi:chemotaxis protein MotB